MITPAAAQEPVAAQKPEVEATKWGGFEPGKGLVLMRSDSGEVDLGLVSYLRYLNQHGIDKTHTSAFGESFDVTPREDFQLAKVQIVFRGWLFDPKFGYNAYVWTSQTSQGLGAQVVAAGNLNWTFNDALKVYFGIQSVPSTRTTNRTFPYFLRNDNRAIADEFFRGSYTQGIWADGKIAKGLEYRAMIANNLSALGVNARQLDANPNTASARSPGCRAPANSVRRTALAILRNTRRSRLCSAGITQAARKRRSLSRARIRSRTRSSGCPMARCCSAPPRSPPAA